MPAAPFDLTRRGRYDKPCGQSAKKEVPQYWKKMTSFGQLWVVGVWDLWGRGNTSSLCIKTYRM
jgi:hypothetical protein